MTTPDRRALRRIELKNLLSFGPDSPALELENLNILIGANGSGKSNLIEAISLLRATPMPAASEKDLRTVLRDGGGTDEWIWKGGSGHPASVEITIHSDVKPNATLRHRIAFSSDQNRFRLKGEDVFNVFNGSSESLPFYRLEEGILRIASYSDATGALVERAFSRDVSVLSALRDPLAFPELSQFARLYEEIRIYREWPFGRKMSIRSPQQLDQIDDRLDEEFSNLCLFLKHLKPEVGESILMALKDLYQGVTNFDFIIDHDGGTIQLFFHEGDIRIPARRLSDGTLHYLCLVAILCDPNPPPLICIEEPELGLHPDLLPKLADLLVAASERTQLIVTTHSDVLVDCMTERPEVVVTCEKHEGQTHMRRLTKDEVEPWLRKYRLGELWSRGHIGANRW